LSKQTKLIQTIKEFLHAALGIKGSTFSEKFKSLGPILLKFLEQKAIKTALIKFFGTASVGGFRAKALTWFITEIIFDKALEPIIKSIFNYAGYQIDRGEGYFKFKKTEDARRDNDQVEYDSTVDDILN